MNQSARRASFPKPSLLPCSLVLMLSVCATLECRAERLPYLISQQPKEVRDTFVEVRALVAENEALPEPAADPYIALGDIWSSVGAHEDALQNYLKAAAIASAEGPQNLADRSRLLTRLQAAMSSLSAVPRRKFLLPAREAYRHGMAALTQNDPAKAITYFEESVRLNTDDVLYRCALAISYRRDGNHERAEHQANAAGALFRRQTAMSAVPIRKLIGKQLERIQGQERIWLEAHLVAVGSDTGP